MRARRQQVVDEYVEEGRAAVYTTTGMVVLLSELATAAWAVLGDEWLSADEVAQALVRRFGAPEDGEADQITADALRSLADMALVDIEETADPSYDD